MSKVFKNGYQYIYLNQRPQQIEILKMNASKVQKAYIEKAFQYIVGKKQIKKEDDSDEIIGRIYSLAEMLSIESSAKIKHKDFISDFYEYYCISDEIIKEILPSIEKLRQELFSRKDPPFLNNPQAAFNWLEKEADKEAAPFCQNNKKNREEINQLHNKILGEIQELSRLTNITHVLSSEKHLVPYPGEEGWLKKIDVWEGTPLAKLEKQTRGLFDQTMLTRESLILFVLTGIKPVFLSYKISTSYPPITTKRIKVDLEIYRPLKKKTFDEIYSKLKEAFGKKRKRFLEEKHADLKRLVEKYGGPPPKNKGKFWHQIMEEWKKIHPENAFGHENSPRMAYQRIIRRLTETATSASKPSNQISIVHRKKNSRI